MAVFSMFVTLESAYIILSTKLWHSSWYLALALMVLRCCRFEPCGLSAVHVASQSVIAVRATVPASNTSFGTVSDSAASRGTRGRASMLRSSASRIQPSCRPIEHGGREPVMVRKTAVARSLSNSFTLAHATAATRWVFVGRPGGAMSGTLLVWNTKLTKAWSLGVPSKDAVHDSS
jgi:hypothetical protein